MGRLKGIGDALCTLVEMGNEGGREAERAAIVAWLRGPGPDRDNGGPCRHVEHVQGYCTCGELATAIEAGEHHGTQGKE